MVNVDKFVYVVCKAVKVSNTSVGIKLLAIKPVPFSTIHYDIFSTYVFSMLNLLVIVSI